MFRVVKWSIRYRMVDVASTTEFHRLESGTASNRYQWDIVRVSIGMPISNLIKSVYLRRLFQFRSGYLSAVELLTSFQQTDSVVADIKTTYWHFRLAFADIDIDFYMMLNDRRGISSRILSVDIVGHINLRHRMVDVVSTAELHGIYIDTTSGAISTLHKNNDIETIS